MASSWSWTKDFVNKQAFSNVFVMEIMFLSWLLVPVAKLYEKQKNYKNICSSVTFKEFKAALTPFLASYTHNTDILSPTRMVW